MLREYLSTAASLMVEALLGTPRPVEACGEGCTRLSGYGYGGCNSCGAGKKNRYRVFKCGVNIVWCMQDCVYC
jgi:hypothetical protein